MPKKSTEILIVDDSEELLWTMANVLEKSGLSVDAVTSGKDAVEFMRRYPQTQVVILNYLLPDMSGLSVLDHIQQNGTCPKVIVVTAYGIDEIRYKFSQSRAWAFMEKPFDINHLIAVCQQALKQNMAVCVDKNH
jgi:DNA-binding NtrC family response regulator